MQQRKNAKSRYHLDMVLVASNYGDIHIVNSPLIASVGLLLKSRKKL